jgi:hypothetical protein
MCMRWQPPATTLAMVLLLSAVAPGCLKDGTGPREDLSKWEMGMTIEKFESNASIELNTTYFSFTVRWGPLQFDDWVVSESEGFKKGNDSYFPFRIEAFYKDPSNGRTPFPIQGGSNVVTGAIEVLTGKLRPTIDGSKSTYRFTNEYDRFPSPYETTVRILGTDGQLVLYFVLLAPTGS